MKRVDSTVESPRMEVKKFGMSYGHLVKVMLEMEEDPFFFHRRCWSLTWQKEDGILDIKK